MRTISKKNQRVVVLLAICLCVLTLFIKQSPAKADVIWEPNDEFYMDNYDSCTYEGRSYLTAGKDGKVIVYKTPNGKKKIDEFTNGVKLYVSFVYKDEKVTWGVVAYINNDDGTVENSYGNDQTGWIKMSDLSLIYDEQSFREEYGDKITKYTGNFNQYEVKQQIYVWSYPYSGVVNGQIDKEQWTTNEISLDITDYYVDENQVEWGYVGYYYGLEGWICLSDPENKDLPVVEHENVVNNQNEVIDQNEVNNKNGISKTEAILILLVIGVVVITTVMIIRIKRRTEE